jgi:hypothetical protein
MRTLAALFLYLVGAGAAVAQTGRQALAAGAARYLLADYRGAAPLLARGLDPQAGPLDQRWKDGVQRLADVLLVLRNDSLAVTWLRWASRLSPDFEVDEDAAPPAVVRAARAARAFVDSTPRDPFVASAEFHWPHAPVSDALGTVRLAAASIPITARIGADQFLRGAEARRLPPGSYDVVVSAPGYLPTRLTIELLSGVETLVRVSLLPETAGLLYVAARPWGTLFVDGERIGYTSVAAHHVAPGSHVIRLKRDSGPPTDTTVVIAPRARVRVSWVVRLDPLGVPRIDAALAQLDVAETERGAAALREALAPDQPPLAPPVRARAFARLAEAMWSLGARDSARACLREVVRADPFYTPAASLFNPELQPAYVRVRGQTTAIALRGPRDTALTPLRDTLPIEIAVGRPGEVRMLLRLTAPRAHDSVLTVLRVDSLAIARLPLTAPDGQVLASGGYAIEGVVAAASSAASALLQLTVEHTPTDTTPHASAIPHATYRPETRKGGVTLRTFREGVGLGALAFLVSAAVNNAALSGRSVPPGALLIGGSVTLATVALERPTLSVSENVSYNDSLRVAWEARDRVIAAQNAALLERAPLRIRTAPAP